jgi:hypothetical protein
MRALLTLNATERVRREMMLAFCRLLEGREDSGRRVQSGFHTPATIKTDADGRRARAATAPRQSS